MNIDEILDKQRVYLEMGQTQNVSNRIAVLDKLSKAIESMEDEIYLALEADLGKSTYESYMCEVSMVQAEIKHMKKHGVSYAKKKKAKTVLGQFPSKTYVVPEPFGSVLIMSPWNYPFMLTMEPLVDAIMAGNTVVLKPSNYSPNVSGVIHKLIEFCFPEEYVAVIEGGREVNQTLLDHKFDYIFFTGSKQVGHIVMEKAAAYLTPISLELGGKSPCIIDETADLKVAANRVAFGKFINAGQTCVAPDYLLIQENVKDEFLKHLKKAIIKMYGKQPTKREDYVKIINEKHFLRLKGLMENEEVVFGGRSDEETRRIEPTIIDDVSEDSLVMSEEIFGPILPVLTFYDLEEAIQFVRRRPKPLALYFFTTSKERMDQIEKNLSYGGGCFNDTLIHMVSSNMPFGGVGESGMGAYHGKTGFDTFSHYKSIVRKTYRKDIALRFPPYTKKKEEKLRRFMK